MRCLSLLLILRLSLPITAVSEMFVMKRWFARVAKPVRVSRQSGAKRRGIIMTVLATLNTRFEAFTLNQLIDEISQWAQAGLSRFQRELAALEKTLPPPVC